MMMKGRLPNCHYFNIFTTTGDGEWRKERTDLPLHARNCLLLLLRFPLLCLNENKCVFLRGEENTAIPSHTPKSEDGWRRRKPDTAQKGKAASTSTPAQKARVKTHFWRRGEGENSSLVLLLLLLFPHPSQ